MSLTEAAQFATDTEARPPLTAALVAAAVSIMNEAGNTPNHAERVALAAQIMRSPLLLVEAFAWAVSTNATVVAQWAAGNHEGATNDFAFAVASVWDSVAGVPANDPV